MLAKRYDGTIYRLPTAIWAESSTAAAGDRIVPLQSLPWQWKVGTVNSIKPTDVERAPEALYAAISTIQSSAARPRLTTSRSRTLALPPLVYHHHHARAEMPAMLLLRGVIRESVDCRISPIMAPQAAMCQHENPCNAVHCPLQAVLECGKKEMAALL